MLSAIVAGKHKDTVLNGVNNGSRPGIGASTSTGDFGPANCRQGASDLANALEFG